MSINQITPIEEDNLMKQWSVNSAELAVSLSSDFESYFVAHKNQGRDFYLALKNNNDLAGIQRKSDSLDSIGYKHFNDVIASMKRFDSLLSASDAELEKAYYSYFEPRVSDFYLGGVLSALEYASFREWFYEANTDKLGGSLTEPLLNVVKIVEKMAQIQKRLAEQR